MQTFKEAIGYFLLALTLIFFDCFTYGTKRLVILLVLGLLLTAAVVILTIMALYEAVRHCRAKRPW